MTTRILIVLTVALLSGCSVLFGESAEITVRYASAAAPRDIDVILLRLRERSRALFPRYEVRQARAGVAILARGGPAAADVRALLGARGVLDVRFDGGLGWFNSTEIEDLTATVASTGEPVLLIRLTPRARARVARLSDVAPGRVLTVKLDGAEIARATLVAPIPDGMLRLTLATGADSLANLAAVLRHGPLSATPETLTITAR